MEIKYKEEILKNQIFYDQNIKILKEIDEFENLNIIIYSEGSISFNQFMKVKNLFRFYKIMDIETDFRERIIVKNGEKSIKNENFIKLKNVRKFENFNITKESKDEIENFIEKTHKYIKIHYMIDIFDKKYIQFENLQDLFLNIILKNEFDRIYFEYKMEEVFSKKFEKNYNIYRNLENIQEISNLIQKISDEIGDILKDLNYDIKKIIDNNNLEIYNQIWSRKFKSKGFYKFIFGYEEIYFSKFQMREIIRKYWSHPHIRFFERNNRLLEYGLYNIFEGDYGLLSKSNDILSEDLNFKTHLSSYFDKYKFEKTIPESFNKEIEDEFWTVKIIDENNKNIIGEMIFYDEIQKVNFLNTIKKNDRYRFLITKKTNQNEKSKK